MGVSSMIPPWREGPAVPRWVAAVFSAFKSFNTEDTEKTLCTRRRGDSDAAMFQLHSASLIAEIKN
jgi:hypothetical protein